MGGRCPLWWFPERSGCLGGAIFKSGGSTLALLIDFFVDWLPYIDIVVARRKAGTTTTAATAAVPDHDITPPGAARPAAARPRRVGSVELARGCYDEGQVKATCALRCARVESSPASRRRPTPTTARDVRRTTQTSAHLRLAGRQQRDKKRHSRPANTVTGHMPLPRNQHRQHLPLVSVRV